MCLALWLRSCVMHYYRTHVSCIIITLMCLALWLRSCVLHYNHTHVSCTIITLMRLALSSHSCVLHYHHTHVSCTIITLMCLALSSHSCVLHYHHTHVSCTIITLMCLALSSHSCLLHYHHTHVSCTLITLMCLALPSCLCVLHFDHAHVSESALVHCATSIVLDTDQWPRYLALCHHQRQTRSKAWETRETTAQSLNRQRYNTELSTLHCPTDDLRFTAAPLFSRQDACHRHWGQSSHPSLRVSKGQRPQVCWLTHSQHHIAVLCLCLRLFQCTDYYRHHQCSHPINGIKIIVFIFLNTITFMRERERERERGEGGGGDSFKCNVSAVHYLSS